MAQDIHALVKSLKYDRIRLVGHDIGLMVAYAYAAQYPSEVDRIVLMEAFLPGVGDWNNVFLLRDLWHFHFFGKTPLALVYVLKMRRFVLMYLLALPFALVDRVGWATPLLTVLLAYAVLGIDQIGVELERPFSTRSLSHLPLDTICGDIERQLLALLNEPPLEARSAEVSAPHRASRSAPALRKAERVAS